jgi:hypothetical protein
MGFISDIFDHCALFWVYSLSEGLLSGFSALLVWYHSALFPAIEIKRKGVRDMTKGGKF